MKKWTQVVTHIAIAATAAVTLAAGAQARDMQTIVKDGTIKMATEGEFAPFNFFEGKKLTGFEVELAEAAAQKMGLKVEWKALPFDGLLTGLQQDRWDLVIASHGITPERAKAVTFTEPHYCSGGVIVSKGGKVKTVADLKGKTVVAQTGTSYLENVAKIDGVKQVKNYPKDDDARNAVLTRRADAQVTDRFLALEYNKKNADKGLQLGDMVFEERIASAVQLGNTELANEWNKTLAGMLEDGSYQALSEKYFGQDVRCALVVETAMGDMKEAVKDAVKDAVKKVAE